MRRADVKQDGEDLDKEKERRGRATSLVEVRRIRSKRKCPPSGV